MLILNAVFTVHLNAFYVPGAMAEHIVFVDMYTRNFIWSQDLDLMYVTRPGLDYSKVTLQIQEVILKNLTSPAHSLSLSLPLYAFIYFSVTSYLFVS